MARSSSEIAHAVQILGLLAVALGGGIWLGQVDAKAASAMLIAGKVEQIKIDQAVIREQIKTIVRDGVARDKRQREDGQKRDDKLEAILQEIRRRNTNGR